jgi:integrase
MRQRFQSGCILKRGKRRQVWVGRWREPIIREGQLVKVNRSEILGAVSEMTKGEALEARIRPLNEGTHRPAERLNFGRFCERWEETVLPTYRESTRNFYHATLRRYILPRFKEWDLMAIQPPDVQAFLNTFAQTYSSSVVKHVRATLSRIMASAVDWGHVQRNPALGVRLPRAKGITRARVLAPGEVRMVLANLEEPYRTMVLIGALTGLRESELLALKWEDFDLSRLTLKVERSVYRGVVDTTKTKRSAREIPCPKSALTAIRELARSGHNRGDFVFTAPKGGFYSGQRITAKVFRPLAQRLGLLPFTWRSLRRSAASALHTQGTPLKVQQAILSHTSPEMSLVYVDVDPEAKRQAVSSLESGLFPHVPKLQSQLQQERAN